MRITTSLRHHQGATYDDVVEAAVAAEELGYDAVFLPDHILPLDILQADKQTRVGHIAETARPHGPSDAWTYLAGLARDTRSIRIGSLVTCSMFRPPAMLAIQVANVNAMSGGRVDLGIGAGWLAVEHEAYGFAFPPLGTRFRMFEEQLAILRGIWDTPAGEAFSFDGEFYTLKDAAPTPHGDLPRPRLFVGGSGLVKTPRLGATFADELNGHADRLEDCYEYFEAAAKFCEELGRDPKSLARSVQIHVCCGEDQADIERQAALVGHSVEHLRSRMFVGTPYELVEFLKPYEEFGFDRVNLGRRLPIDVDSLRLIGEEVLPHFERRTLPGSAILHPGC
jgi:alkanesulfonate monooxygenase SsuD/methylene tetrahydromethanopterin reductase-like flavin-dependent oxidoreductase (luciferase family)